MRTKEEKNKYGREYYQKNIDKVRKYAVDYGKKNRLKKSEREKEKYKANPEFYRIKSLIKLYGENSIEIIDLLYKSQGGCCAICGIHEKDLPFKNGKKQRLHVDHCHTTGKIRGLLCGPHNMALGGFSDSIFNLESAKQYLIKNG